MVFGMQALILQRVLNTFARKKQENKLPTCNLFVIQKVKGDN